MQKHAIVVDLGYGDAGKGAFVDFLCERKGYNTVVRYNGGAQAAHRVVRQDGREHVFRQYGSGTFSRNVQTVLSRWMLVDPLAVARETDELDALRVIKPLIRLHVHEDALVTTPVHATANRMDEVARGSQRHGSCGRGIGKTREYAIKHPEDALYVRDLKSIPDTEGKLMLMAGRMGPPARPNGMRELAEAFNRFYRSVHIVNDVFMEALLRQQAVVFEGAQGVLLDEKFGFPPFYTWTDTTPANAISILQTAGIYQREAYVKYGLTRSYSTRHGAGPFPTESPLMAEMLPDPANGLNEWQGSWRAGPLDLVALKYAVAACGGVDRLVVSCLDRVERGEVCVAYTDDYGKRRTAIPQSDTVFMRQVRPVYQTEALPIVRQIREYLKIPVAVKSYGPTAADKVEL